MAVASEANLACVLNVLHNAAFRRVAVIGGGPTGLSLAVALADEGIRTVVYE